MKEEAHYQRVVEFLEGRGYTCYRRVKYGKFEYDVVGLSENGKREVAVVEVKEVYLKKLIEQALRRKRQGIFNWIFIAFPFKYRLKGVKASRLKRAGIGAINLETMEVVIEPEPQKVIEEEQGKFLSYLLDNVVEVDDYTIELRIRLAYDDYMLLIPKLRKLGVSSAGELLRRIASARVEKYEI